MRLGIGADRVRLCASVERIGTRARVLLQNLTAASVKTIEVTGRPFAAAVAGSDHRDPLVGVERPDTAELERQGVQSAERGPAEPTAIRTRVEL